jgi:hypothetical protein
MSFAKSLSRATSCAFAQQVSNNMNAYYITCSFTKFSKVYNNRSTIPVKLPQNNIGIQSTKPILGIFREHLHTK